jgi:hypothetical protein
VWLEGLGQLKNSNDIGNLTHDLPVYSIGPQPTTLLCTHSIHEYFKKEDEDSRPLIPFPKFQDWVVAAYGTAKQTTQIRLQGNHPHATAAALPPRSLYRGMAGGERGYWAHSLVDTQSCSLEKPSCIPSLVSSVGYAHSEQLHRSINRPPKCYRCHWYDTGSFLNTHKYSSNAVKRLYVLSRATFHTCTKESAGAGGGGDEQMISEWTLSYYTEYFVILEEAN